MIVFLGPWILLFYDQGAFLHPRTVIQSYSRWTGFSVEAPMENPDGRRYTVYLNESDYIPLDAIFGSLCITLFIGWITR